MRELAVRLGLEVRELALLPASPGQMLIHWMGVLAPFKTAQNGPWFRARRTWHASLLAAYITARIVAPLRRLPPNPAPHFLLLVARKPVR
ncbi:MAG: hypothetical protein JWO26_2345 [Rhodospirillales bacterium]|nr:hypothetical protein [Rhodospirillales bacterium]